MDNEMEDKGHPWGECVGEMVLGPCCREGGPEDWWTEKHKSCTGGYHIGPGKYYRCTCDCHKQDWYHKGMTASIGAVGDISFVPMDNSMMSVVIPAQSGPLPPLTVSASLAPQCGFSHHSILEEDEELVTMDGFDHCIIGTCERYGQLPVVAYDYEKVINTLMNRDSMSYDDAVEFFEYNQLGAYVGERTPVFVSMTARRTDFQRAVDKLSNFAGGTVVQVSHHGIKIEHHICCNYTKPGRETCNCGVSDLIHAMTTVKQEEIDDSEFLRDE